MLNVVARYFGLCLLSSAILTGCSSSTTAGRNAEPNPRVLPAAGSPAPDVSDLYRQIGLIAAAGPVEQDDRSVILVPLKDEARKIAEQVVADIKGAGADGSEPF